MSVFYQGRGINIDFPKNMFVNPLPICQQSDKVYHSYIIPELRDIVVVVCGKYSDFMD